ncbi:hypothetical protein KXD40_001598 [Peronospora effusa]|nr:hypothetical protein KXD40_001598 [Peronospora effusa]
MLFRATCTLLSNRWLAHLATRDDVMFARPLFHYRSVRVVRAGVAILVVAVLKDVVARLDTSLMNVSWCEFEQTRGYSEQDDMAGESLRIRRSGVCLRPCEHVVPSDMYATIESLASSPCYSR